MNSRVDLDQLISREDSMAVRRQMMKEENEQFQEVLDQTQRRSSLSGEDEEFNRLVTRTQVENLPADEPAPTEVCLSL